MRVHFSSMRRKEGVYTTIYHRETIPRRIKRQLTLVLLLVLEFVLLCSRKVEGVLIDVSEPKQEPMRLFIGRLDEKRWPKGCGE